MITAIDIQKLAELIKAFYNLTGIKVAVYDNNFCEVVAYPDRIKELIDKSVPEGAEAFGMQFEQMKSEYRTKKCMMICSHMPRISRYM